MKTSLNFVIIGPGKVGSMLGILAAKTDFEISGVIARSQNSGLKIKKLLSLPEQKCFTYENLDLSVLEKADFIAITVKDDEIPDVVGQLNQLRFTNSENGIVFHCSGHKSSVILKDLENKGLLIGSLHPLKSVANSQVAAESFAGTYCAVEASEKAVVKLENLVAQFQGISFQVASKDKPLYHAAAVIACNYWIALLDVSLQIYKKIGIDGATAQKLLQPLIQGTLNNFVQNGIPQSLTGPIERGDLTTIKEHIHNIEAEIPEILELYKMLGRWTTDVAKRKGLSDDQRETILSLLR